MHSSYHPSTTPGAIIGYRKNGTPIRLAAGGDETHEGGNTSTDHEGGTGTTGAGDGQNGDQGGTGGQPTPGQVAAGRAAGPLVTTSTPGPSKRSAVTSRPNGHDVRP